jgi:O-antigen ligase
MDRLLWISGLLLAAAWLSPLHVLPWMSAHNEALGTLAALVGCAGALLLHRRGEGEARVLIPSVTALPMLIGALGLLQWLVGRIGYAGSVWVIGSYVVLCAAAAAAGHAAVRVNQVGPGEGQCRPLQALAVLLVFVGLAQVLINFSQTLSLWEGAAWVARIGYETRGGGNVAQPNQAAQLFLMAIASTVYLRQAAPLRPPVAVATLALLALGLATTQSRSGIIALVLLVGWYVLRRGVLPQGGRALPALAFLALALVLFAGWYPLASAYWLSTGDEVNLTASGRTAIWVQLAEAVRLRPWFGWGVMQVAEAQNAIADAYPLVMASTFAHNLFLDLALWLGIPAMLVATAMVVKWLWPRLSQARSLDACFCVALTLPFAVQAMTEFPYAYTYLLLPVFFVLGIFDALVGRNVGLRLPRGAAVAIVAAWVGTSLWAIVEYAQIEEDFRMARFEALRVGSTPASYHAPEVRVLTQLGALLHATRVQLRPGMPAEELEVLRNVAMLHPWGQTNFRYATALALNGQMDEALRQLQVLRATQGPRTYESVLKILDEMSVQNPVLKELRLP